MLENVISFLSSAEVYNQNVILIRFRFGHTCCPARTGSNVFNRQRQEECIAPGEKLRALGKYPAVNWLSVFSIGHQHFQLGISKFSYMRIKHLIIDIFRSTYHLL